MLFLAISFASMDHDTPKPIVDLLELLSRHDELVAQNVVGEAIAMPEHLDFTNQQTQLHTETSYVLDLTQGELQPLEDLDEELLGKMDMDAIIAAELEKLNDPQCYPNPVKQDCGKKVMSHVPSLLKLHTAKPAPHPKE